MKRRHLSAIIQFKIDGDNDTLDGAYWIPHAKIKNYIFQVIASTGLGWDHVSVCLRNDGAFVKRCPTWEEMCWIKDFFFESSETVVQYHPASKNYVNVHNYVLHLWRPQNIDIPTPETIMV